MPFGDDTWGRVGDQGRSWRSKPPKPPKRGGCGKKAAAFMIWGSISGYAIAHAIVQSFT